MKILISCDMEGIAGISHKDQTIPGSKGYEDGRDLLTNEVNAAIEGLLSEPGVDITVADAHLDMRNIRLEKLNPQARYISGEPRTLQMVEGIDSSFDAAVFIGYHAKVGTENAVIDHTYYSSGIVQDVRINGKSVGETALNGAVCGYYGVPVILVTGDDKLVKEARETLGTVNTVQVKEGLGRFSAKTLAPAEACRLVERAAAEAVQSFKKGDNYKPFQFPGDINLEVDFSYTTMAEVAAYMPGVRRIKGRTVSFASADYIEVYKAFHAIYRLAESAK